jgi:hypothetical protein
MARINWERNNKAKKVQRRGIDASPMLLALPAEGRSKAGKTTNVDSLKKMLPAKIKKRTQPSFPPPSHAAAIRTREERDRHDEQRREELKKKRIRKEAAMKLAAERKADPVYQAKLKRKIAARAEKRMAKVTVEWRLRSGQVVVTRGVRVSVNSRVPNPSQEHPETKVR